MNISVLELGWLIIVALEVSMIVYVIIRIGEEI